jgi:hypothetical protein
VTRIVSARGNRASAAVLDATETGAGGFATVAMEPPS